MFSCAYAKLPKRVGIGVSCDAADQSFFNKAHVSLTYASQERCEADHLSKTHFDTEICRCFLGLNDAAALKVLASVPKKGKMVSCQAPSCSVNRTWS